MSTITEYFTIELGVTLTYKKGDVVFWGGEAPTWSDDGTALGTMADNYKFYEGCRFPFAKFEGWEDNRYNSLHYSLLRPATSAEKAILGDRKFVSYIPNK